MTTPDELRKQAASDYSYVATDALFINGVRAFNKGDLVPVQHVDAGLVNADLVAKTSTKAGRAVVDDTKEG